MEGIVLAVWDHIMGPQIKKLWLISENSNEKIFVVPDNILHNFNVSKYCSEMHKMKDIDLSAMKLYICMCGQLLLSEVDSWKSTRDWSSRLYISEDKVLLAILFHLNCWEFPNSSRRMKKHCFCLGILFKSEVYGNVVLNHLYIDQHLRKTVDLLTSSEMPVCPSLIEISIMVDNITELLMSMEEINLDKKLKSVLSFENFMSMNIVSQAIVSHLKSSGCTAIFGSSDFHINQMINLLASFNLQIEQGCFSTVSPQFVKSYIIGLYVQNINEGTKKTGKDLLEKAVREQNSLTVIDLDVHKVWCTIPFKDSSKINKNSISLVHETGCLVPDLIRDLIFLERDKKDFRKFIKKFSHGLMTKACALVEFIEYSRFSENIFTKSKMMTILGVQTSVDMEILLGYAEKIKPGIRNTFVE